MRLEDSDPLQLKLQVVVELSDRGARNPTLVLFKSSTCP